MLQIVKMSMIAIVRGGSIISESMCYSRFNHYSFALTQLSSTF